MIPTGRVGLTGALVDHGGGNGNRQGRVSEASVKRGLSDAVQVQQANFNNACSVLGQDSLACTPRSAGPTCVPNPIFSVLPLALSIPATCSSFCSSNMSSLPAPGPLHTPLYKCLCPRAYHDSHLFILQPFASVGPSLKGAPLTSITFSALTPE